MDAKNAITNVMGRGGLLAKKYSPQILLGVGITCVITSTVLACKATLKLDEVLAKTQDDLEKVKTASETISEEEYSSVDQRKDLAIVYGRRGADLAKLYGPAVLVGLAGIGCLVGSHAVLSKRNIALIAAYKLAEESFSNYRDRVVEDLGPEKDRKYRYGITQETKTETTVDSDGKKIKVKSLVEVVEDGKVSGYARFFDQMSPAWQKDATLNMYFLRTQQQFANDVLKSRGHLFLNEVYDMLGIPRSQAGAVVGWVRNNSEGDNFVDFGLYNPENPAGRDFVNSYEKSILLDFNVDGIIYDLI